MGGALLPQVREGCGRGSSTTSEGGMWAGKGRKMGWRLDATPTW